MLEAMKRWFWMGDAQRPRYTHQPEESLYHVAQAAGEHPVETWLRITDQTDGKALFHMRGFNTDLEALQKLITMDWAMPGLGDAGAHVSQMIDSGWATFVLSHWARDAGVYSLQEAVRRISAVPADVLGLDDRGTLAVGKRPTSTSSNWTGWRSGCRKSSTTFHSARRASSSALWATRRRCATVRSFSATTN